MTLQCAYEGDVERCHCSAVPSQGSELALGATSPSIKHFGSIILHRQQHLQNKSPFLKQILIYKNWHTRPIEQIFKSLLETM